MMARVLGPMASSSAFRDGSVVAQVDIHKDRHKPILHDGCYGGGKAGCNGDDFVAGPQAAVTQLGGGQGSHGNQVGR